MVFRRSRKAGKTGQETGKGNALTRRFEAGDDSPTVLIETDAASEPALADDAATRILPREAGQPEPATDDPMQAPPVGLLLVIDGPGKGHMLPFSYGMNPIGRSPTERLSLDFGDERISREGHALVTYDGEARKFYLQHGGGANLTWVDGNPVLEPRELTARQRIRLGDTTLMFIPLCAASFDWQDKAD